MLVEAAALLAKGGVSSCCLGSEATLELRTLLRELRGGKEEKKIPGINQPKKELLLPGESGRRGKSAAAESNCAPVQERTAAQVKKKCCKKA